MFPETAIPVLSGVCAPDLWGREGRVLVGGGTCQDRAKTIRCDGEVGSLLGWRMIAFLGCQTHLAGLSSFGSSISSK